MEYLIGVVLAVGVGISLTLLKMDRDRAVYPVILIVVASYYDLFAVMGGQTALISEIVAGLIFIALAVAGFRYTLWFAAAGLLGHGIFDLVHGYLIANPGVPSWWPGFCSGYDVAAAGYLGMLLIRGPRRRST